MHRSSHQQLITMISVDLNRLEGLLCSGTKVFSLDCVTLAIIMDMMLYIVEPMLKIEIHGVGIVMRTLGTKVRETLSESHPLHLVAPKIDLEHQIMKLSAIDVTNMQT